MAPVGTPQLIYVLIVVLIIMSTLTVCFFLIISLALASTPPRPPTTRSASLAASGGGKSCPLEALNLRRESSVDYATSDDDNSPVKKRQVQNALLKRTLARNKLVDSQYGVPHLSLDVSFRDSECSSSLGTGSGIASSQPDSEVGHQYDFQAQSLFDFSVDHLNTPEKEAITAYCKDNKKAQKKAERAAKTGKKY